MAKGDARRAEVACERWLGESHNCYTHRVKGSSTFQSVDVFASDVIGKTTTETWYCQVTTGGYESVRVRKHKMAEVPWCPSDRVLLVQMVKTGRPMTYWFKIQEYDRGEEGNEWRVWTDMVLVPRDWFLVEKGN